MEADRAEATMASADLLPDVLTSVQSQSSILRWERRQGHSAACLDQGSNFLMLGLDLISGYEIPLSVARSGAVSSFSKVDTRALPRQLYCTDDFSVSLVYTVSCTEG